MFTTYTLNHTEIRMNRKSIVIATKFLRYRQMFINIIVSQFSLFVIRFIYIELTIDATKSINLKRKRFSVRYQDRNVILQLNNCIHRINLIDIKVFP